MRTPDPDPATKRNLLDAAEGLMLKKGFVATTVDEICSEAKVTKGSFFHYFDSKEDLGKVVLERFAEKGEAMVKCACGSLEDPLQRVHAMIDSLLHVVREGSARGCLVGTFAQEISHTHPQLRDICRKSFEGLAEAVARDLVLAKKRHAPRAAFEADSLGDFFVALFQGSLLVLKTTGDRKMVERNLLHFKRYLGGLYGT